MSRAAARQIELARRSIRGALTLLECADVLGELTEDEGTAFAVAYNDLQSLESDLGKMAARAESRQQTHTKGER